MHARIKAIGIVAAILGSSLTVSLPAEAATSCKTVNKHYPSGVAASKYSKNSGPGPIETPKVRLSVYKKYRHLDTDKDKIVCEVLAKALPYSEVIINNAINAVEKRLSSAKPFAGDIRYFVSSNYPKKSAELDLASAKTGVSYFQDLYLFGGADFIFFSEQDATWAQEKLDSITAGTTLDGIMAYDKGQPWACRGSEYSYVKNGLMRYITVQCNDGDQVGNASFGVHGATHWFQSNYGTHKMPGWLVEGSASFYGEVIGYGTKSPLAKEPVWNGDYLTHNALKAGPNSIRAKIKEVSAVNNPPGIDYVTSRMVYQALVGLYGEDKAIQFIQSFGSSSDVSQNFFMVYNITIDMFYEEAIPLIADWAVRVWK